MTRGPRCKELRNLTSTRNTQYVARGILLGKEGSPVPNVWAPARLLMALNEKASPACWPIENAQCAHRQGRSGCERGVRCASNGSATSFVVESRWMLQQEGWTADLLDLGSPLVAGRKDRLGIWHTRGKPSGWRTAGH